MQTSDFKHFAVVCSIGMIVSWILLLSTFVAVLTICTGRHFTAAKLHEQCYCEFQRILPQPGSENEQDMRYKPRLNDYENIPKSYIDEMKETFERGGAAALKTLVFDHLNEWKNIDINIAVTGNTGVGKSSFINALRGLTAEDEGAAKVGYKETTKEMTPYLHPENERLVLWDLPGVGTPRFLRENYLETIQASKYDYFIIISSERFTENDLWLAKSLQQKRKAFYFVRTKVIQAIENDRKSYPKSHNPETVIKDIREDCRRNLEENGIEKTKVRLFLIDTYDIQKYEFNLLHAHLLADAPELKKEAMVFSIHVMSESLILSKKEFLLERVHNVALASAVAGAIPFPGLDVAVDIYLLFEESEFYRVQFGLDDNSLLKFGKKFGMSVEELQTSLDLKSKSIEFSAKGLLNYFARIGVKKTSSKATSKIVKYILPGIGSIASAAMSYTVTYYCLEHLLDVMVNDALRLNNAFLNVSK